LACSVPIACIAFLITADNLYWSKSRPPALELPLELSVHAYADYLAGQATFACAVGGAYLPSVPIQHTGHGDRDVSLQITGHRTGALSPLAHTKHADLIVYVIPASVLKTGRKRLWHLRRALSTSLPPSIAELLTHRRSGRVRPSV
jgi:hypothetical protein